MQRRTTALVLVVGVCLVGGLVGGVEWYRATDTAVYEDDDAIALDVAEQRVATLGSTETRAVASAEEDGTVLAAVYVPDSSVQSTELVVVWSLPDGLWYDAQVEIEPAGRQSASFGEPTPTRYAGGHVLGGDPEVASTGSRNRLDYPLGSDHGRIDTLVRASGDAGEESVAFECRLTARSITGQSVDVSVPFEIDYSELRS